MSFPSRLGIQNFVSASTLIICPLGVHAELKMSEASIAALRRTIEALLRSMSTNSANSMIAAVANIAIVIRGKDMARFLPRLTVYDSVLL
jgi:hypothetical protein